MKHPKLALLSLCIALFATTLKTLAKGEDSIPQRRQYTVLCYNVRNCLTNEGKMDFDDVAATILECGADFVALQELDSVTGRCDSLYVLGELATRTGMFPSYAPAILYDGGKYGIGILSREQPLSAHQIPLPGREEKRTLLVAEFRDFVIACTHLSLTEKDRFASLPLIEAEAARYSKPFVLAGDFNDDSESAFIRELNQIFSTLPSGNAPTFPATNPNVQIDYITIYNATASPLTWGKSSVLKHTGTSDHRALLNRFYLRTTKESRDTTRNQDRE